MNKDIAFITGTSRGIGRALAVELGAQGYTVIATARDENKAFETAQLIKKNGGNAFGIGLDVRKDGDIKKAVDEVTEKFGKIDIMVNNAGIFDASNNSIMNITEEVLIDSLRTNSFGPLKLIQNFVPLLAKSSNARVVNVSSGMGGLTEMDGGYPAYRLSKTTLNVFTILLAHELKNQGIRVNSICPGWVKTDMGGENATRTLKEGVGSVLAMIDTSPSGPTGGFFRDGHQLPW